MVNNYIHCSKKKWPQCSCSALSILIGSCFQKPAMFIGKESGWSSPFLLQSVPFQKSWFALIPPATDYQEKSVSSRKMFHQKTFFKILQVAVASRINVSSRVPKRISICQKYSNISLGRKGKETPYTLFWKVFFAYLWSYISAMNYGDKSHPYHSLNYEVKQHNLCPLNAQLTSTFPLSMVSTILPSQIQEMLSQLNSAAQVWKVFQAVAIISSYPCCEDLTFAGFTLSDKERANFVTRRQQQPFSIFSAQSFEIPPGRKKRQNCCLERKSSKNIQILSS